MKRNIFKSKAINFLHKNKSLIAMAIGLIMTISMTSIVSFAAQCQEIRNDVLRLHILANSDSIEDQNLKLAVRDRVLKEARDLFDNSQTKEEAESMAKENLPRLIAAAQDEILSRGYDYKVSAELTNCYFETREYEGFTLPAGDYHAVRFIIGSGAGHNWWCVMFPPMCIPVSLEEEPDLSKFTDKELQLVERRPEYEPRFAIVEFLEKLAN